MQQETLDDLRKFVSTKHALGSANEMITQDGKKAVRMIDKFVEAGVPLSAIGTTDWHSAPIKVVITIPYGKTGGGKSKAFRRFSDREIESGIAFWKNPTNVELLDITQLATGGGVKDFKVGDKVKIDYISDGNKHNGQVGTITWLNEYNYYPKGDESVVEKKTQGTIIYSDGSEEEVNDFYREESGLVSPVQKVGGSMAGGGFVPSDIYKFAEQMSDEKYEELYQKLSESEKKNVQSLIRLGDDKKLALSTVMAKTLWEKRNYDKDTWNLYRYFNGGSMAGGGQAGDEGVDLFEDYDNIPPKVQKILDKYEEDFQDGNYAGLEKALKEMNQIGFTFDYYLDGQAYDLRKIGQKGKTAEWVRKNEESLKEPMAQGGNINWGDVKHMGKDPRFKEIVRDDLDDYEQRVYDDFKKHGHGFALQLIINQVEGDYSQLSKRLAVIAKAQDEELKSGHIYSDGGELVGAKDEYHIKTGKYAFDIYGYKTKSDLDNAKEEHLHQLTSVKYANGLSMAKRYANQRMRSWYAVKIEDYKGDEEIIIQDNEMATGGKIDFKKQDHHIYFAKKDGTDKPTDKTLKNWMQFRSSLMNLMPDHHIERLSRNAFQFYPISESDVDDAIRMAKVYDVIYSKSWEMATGGAVGNFATKLEIVDNPFIKEHTLFSDPKQFIDAVNKERYVFVDVGYETKTSLYISIAIDTWRFGINNKVEGLKYLERSEYSYFTYKTTVNQYLKAKSISEIHRHVEGNLKELLPQIQLEGLTLKLYKTQPVLDLIAKGKFEQGGIPNNYEGKEVEQVWNEWTPKQRYHFLNDHVSGWIKMDKRESISKMNWKEFHNVDDDTFNSIARQLESHILFEGQYAHGGGVPVFNSNAGYFPDEIEAMGVDVIYTDNNTIRAGGYTFCRINYLDPKFYLQKN